MNTSVKILIFIITAAVVGAISVIIFGVMLLILNGYSESDALWGIYLFIFWALTGAISAGGLSILAARHLAVKKQLNIALAGLISTVICLIAGIVFNIIGSIAGVVAAEIVRARF